MGDDKVAVENINTPGKVTRVNAQKYEAMRRAYLKVLPEKPPGANQREMLERVQAHIPQALFPEGKTSGWWAKTVQLDLEAKGLVVRTASRPIRWHKA